MDHIPTDIFEDLLHDVVGNKYSGPPLEAADLKVLSGPQAQIDIAKVADQVRFTGRPISSPHWLYDRDFLKMQTSKNYGSTNKSRFQPGFSGKYIKSPHSPASHQLSRSPHTGQDQNHGLSRLSGSSSSEDARLTNRDRLAEHHSSSLRIKFVKPDGGAESKDAASRTQKLHTSDAGAGTGSSHVKDGRDGCAAIPFTDFQAADPECLLMIKNLLQYSYKKWRIQDYDVAKPQFWFLFENTSEEYKYYRLKLAQLLKLKSVTVDTESQANGHGKTAGHLADEMMRKTATASKENPLQDKDFLKIKRIQTATVGTQTDLKMPLFNLSLADIIHHPPRQSPAVPELLHSQIIASQHPASYAPPTAGNTAGAFPRPKGDLNTERFAPRLSLEPRFLPGQIPAPNIAQKMVPCPPATTPNVHWTSQIQKRMETTKTFTTKPHVESKSSINPQFSEIDEMTKKALQSIAHLHVISQEQNQKFDMLKGPEFWFLNEKSSPVYKYYRMKLTELRQASGLPDDNIEFENIGKVCVPPSETKSSNFYGPRTMNVKPLMSEPCGSKAEKPEALGYKHKKPELKGSGQQTSMNLRESKPYCSRPREPAPDMFEVLVTCSDDDEDSDVGDTLPPVKEPALSQDDLIFVTEEDPWQPLEETDLISEEKPVSGEAQQSLYPKPLQNNWELKSQHLKPQHQLHQKSLEPVPTKVSSHSPQEIKSISTESTSKKAMESITVKRSPVSRKRGQLPKGVTVPPKRMYPVKKSTGLEHVPEEAPSQSLDDVKMKSEEISAAEESVLSASSKPELQSSVHQDSLELVPEQVSSQFPRDMESKSAESTSKEVVQSATEEQSPISRKRGRPPKGVTVTPKRMCPAEESTVLVKPGSKEPEACQDLQDLKKTKSKEETSSIDDNSSLEGGSEEVLIPGPEKMLDRNLGNVTPTSTNDALIVSTKRVTRLKK